MTTLPRILIVEDYIDTQKLLTHILNKAGYSTQVAANGKESLEMYNSALLQNTPFDLILMDYFMPVLDGLNATRIMREQGATIPIIMLTANNSVEDQNAAIAAGCSEIMLKPFRKMELLQMIEKWLTSAVKFNKLSCKSGSKINLHS
jgi:CheY-like chemotaxis protein